MAMELELEEEMEGFGEAEDLEGWANESSRYDGFQGLEEFEDEADPFIGDLVRKASSVIKTAAGGGLSKLLPNMAMQAARVAGGAVAGPKGAQLASQIAKRCLREAESEAEFEAEYEEEAMLESAGIDHQALDEAEFLAAQAAEASSTQEAEQFIGALAPVIGQVAGPLLSGLFGGDGETEAEDQFIGDVVSGLSGLLGETEGFDGELEEEGDPFLPALAALAPMAMPLIQKGVSAIGKAFSGNRASRGAIRALPRVAARTAATLARQARSGRQITPNMVAANLARQTARTLGSRPRLSQAVRANRAAAARAQSRPRPPIGARPRHSVGYGYAPAPRRRRQLVGYIPVYGVRRRGSSRPYATPGLG